MGIIPKTSRWVEYIDEPEQSEDSYDNSTFLAFITGAMIFLEAVAIVILVWMIFQ